MVQKLVILLNGWILPIGGIASEGSAPAACTAGLFFFVQYFKLGISYFHENNGLHYNLAMKPILVSLFFSLGPAPRPGRVMVLMCVCVCLSVCLSVHPYP